SASREPASWDTAEFQGVPYILGIAHPTGFPLFVLLGFVWSHVVAIGSVAFRMNAFSAVTIAAAAFAAYAVALEIGAVRFLALLAELWYAVTKDVWQHADRAEAQDLAVACEAFAIYAFVRWMRGERQGWFLAAFALWGLGMAAHPNALWLLPGLLVGTLVARRKPPLRVVAAALALTALGLGFYLYLPLRSAYIVAHGLDPTLALTPDGGIFWNYHNPSTRGGLMLDLTGSDWDAPRYLLASLNPVHVQDALWAFIEGIGQQFGAFVLVLTLFGVVQAWKRDWRTTLFLCIACTAALLFSVTFSVEGDVARYRLLGLWLAVPLVGAIVPRDAEGWTPQVVRAVLAVFLASGVTLAIAADPGAFRHTAGEGGRWVINAVRPYVPPGSVVMVSWLDATSLAYGAYVDGSLAERVIVSGWDDDRMPLYEKWAQKRPVFILDDPHNVAQISGAKKVADLDAYHVLFEVK
ncbi:MAG: DUF2723 domain-containing protein, partial [Candidatus Eremiobacteraeota bacterium]|nr:DUF2723 domain-containing protein [Candidatus Eremiobacteraeota bacterium]